MFDNILSKYFAISSLDFQSFIKQHLNKTDPEEEEYYGDMFGGLFHDTYGYSYEEESDSNCSSSKDCSQILEAIDNGLNLLSWTATLDVTKPMEFGNFISTFLGTICNLVQLVLRQCVLRQFVLR